MQITEVRIKLVSAKNDKLRAFCSITIDDAFVVRDLKVIEGAKGPFVAMPSRKVMERCSRCGEKNHHRANYCNECGNRLPANRPNRQTDRAGAKLHADIAHPINSMCRELIQSRILERYAEESENAKLPGYHPQDLDADFDAVPYAADEFAPASNLGSSFDEPAEGNGSLPTTPRLSRNADAPADASPSDVEPGFSPREQGARRFDAGTVEAEHSAERRKRKELTPKPPGASRDEFDSEPEDNFGAGLFS